jgi:hypothetical protein
LEELTRRGWRWIQRESDGRAWERKEEVALISLEWWMAWVEVEKGLSESRWGIAMRKGKRKKRVG